MNFNFQFFHLTFQIVILSRPLFDWIYSNPSLLVGNLFADPAKVIGLFLGVDRSEILPEHRTTLLTFQNWFATMDITSEDSDSGSKVSGSNVSGSNVSGSNVSGSNVNGSSNGYETSFPVKTVKSRSNENNPENNGSGVENGSGIENGSDTKVTFSLKLHRSALEILQVSRNRFLNQMLHLSLILKLIIFWTS
jgi:hypothetical protein